MSWKEVAASKQAARLAAIPKEWILAQPPSDDVKDVTGVPAASGILTPKELEITETEVVGILAKLSKGQWTAVEVTTAFCKRAAIAQQLVNCLTEIFFEEALERAKELDAYFARHRKLVGPLHGLPISIKDNFKIKGYDATLGFISWSHQPVQEDSVLIQLLRETGAVLYVKTNVPLAMMRAETENNVWGRTLNPYNRLLTSGGSSGGEAALIALKGSPLGVGTDIGGSIRIPASFGYQYGLRPSFGRFPTYGARSGMPGQEAVNSVNGPMSPSLSAIELFARTVVSSQPWLYDPKVLPIPWRTISLPEKLSFGLIRHDGNITPHPPVRRALDRLVRALKNAGHEIIEWEPLGHKRGAELLAKQFLADGGESIKKQFFLSDEPLPAQMADYFASTAPSVYEMWQLHLERNAWQKEYLEHWKQSAERTCTARPIDGILSPTTPFAAVEHEKFRYVGYTGVWNVLDYSAITFPVHRADPKLDFVDRDFKPVSEDDAAIQALYDPQVYAGGPVGLQLIGGRLEEEKVIAMAGVIENALKASN